MQKDKSLIPKGFYCDGCPYFRILEDRPAQQCGWCDYLDKGDMELNEELEYTNCKTQEVTTAKNLGLPLSLLWDGCKMCGENEYTEEELEEMYKEQRDKNSETE